MPNIPVPESRRSDREISKKRAGLVINLDRNQRMLPCLVLDSSKEGFRLAANSQFRRGQVVELILYERLPSFARCSVVWVGKAGSKEQGELGLKTI